MSSASGFRVDNKRQSNTDSEYICFSCANTNYILLVEHQVSLVAQMVKNPPAILDTWVRSLNWEDTLEEGMTTHCSILAWRISWTEEPGGLLSVGSQKVRPY